MYHLSHSVAELMNPPVRECDNDMHVVWYLSAWHVPLCRIGIVMEYCPIQGFHPCMSQSGEPGLIDFRDDLQALLDVASGLWSLHKNRIAHLVCLFVW